ncbi:MAG: hypothetical protein ACUVRA_09055 [Candidatus Bathyarchaeaceae archaeon]
MLSVLVAHPERSIAEDELAKEAGVSVSEVYRQIKDLVDVGLVAMERVGKSKVYLANQKHFLYEPLKRYTERLRTKLLHSLLRSTELRRLCCLVA